MNNITKCALWFMLFETLFWFGVVNVMRIIEYILNGTFSIHTLLLPMFWIDIASIFLSFFALYNTIKCGVGVINGKCI